MDRPDFVLPITLGFSMCHPEWLLPTIFNGVFQFLQGKSP